MSIDPNHGSIQPPNGSWAAVGLGVSVAEERFAVHDPRAATGEREVPVGTTGTSRVITGRSEVAHPLEVGLLAIRWAAKAVRLFWANPRGRPS